MLHIHKGMGLVSQVFNEDNLRFLQGDAAIGHTRYSTTGAPRCATRSPTRSKRSTARWRSATTAI